MISFGPVPSRRLGKSLGINNIISPKVCSYGCIYCQVGRTLKKSIKREVFFKPEVIYENVSRHIQQLRNEDRPDYLTFVSNGEPTLDVNLGNSINLLKKLSIPIAVITNASLLFDKAVRDNLSMADWVSLKMDAPDNNIWQKINRPSRELDFENHIDYIMQFTAGYKGILCTETMAVDGLNDTAQSFTGLADMIKKISPVKAYLAIPVRPPAEMNVKTPDVEKMNLAWQIFNDMNINTEFLTVFEGTETGFTGNIYEDILNITAVHPLREDTMISLIEKDKADYHVVESLIKQKLIRATLYKGNKFYVREYHLQF